MSDLVIYRFQPDAMNETLLRRLCVGKEALLKKMREEITKAAVNRTPRYYLIVGPRGIGKSHFITLLYYDLKNLKGALPVKLAEEEFSVYRVSDFFSRISEEIENRKFSYQGDMDSNGVTDVVLENLKSKNKMVIIFVENLNQILEDQMGEKDVKQLRSIFQKEDIFIVVATSPLIFTAVSQKSEPFYNFFDIKHLKELTKEEVKELIKAINEFAGGLRDVERYYKRIDPIIKLTGGSPRIVILLYDLMSKDNIPDIEEAFFKILDEYTSYYQDIFKALTGQRRRIFDVLMSIEPATPKEVAETAWLDNNTVVTQLRRLERDGYVISHRIGKNVKYEVRERLFRLWREQRQPLGRKKISILIEFIRLWYTPEEREKEFLDIINHLKADEKLIKKAEYLFCTLSEESKMKTLPDIARESYKQGIPELLEVFVEPDDEKLRRAFEVEKLAVLAEEEKFDDLLGEIGKIVKKSENNKIDLFLMGIVLLHLNKYEEALEFIDEALEIDSGNAGAWYFRGIALLNIQRYEDALHSFDRALDIDSEEFSFWIGRGNVMGHLQQYEDALHSFDRALDIDSGDTSAWSGKGQALKFLQQYEDALHSFDRALDIDSGNTGAWINKATTHLKIAAQEFKKKNYGNALENLNSAMDSFLRTWNAKEEEIKEEIISFFKDLVDSKQIEAVDISLRTILKKKEELTELLELISVALEIVKTKNLKKYYEVHVEQRDVIVDIVRRLTESEEGLPEEYRKSESFQNET